MRDKMKLLNSKIMSINENTSKQILLFSTEKELNLVRMSAGLSREEGLENNIEVAHRTH